MVDWFILMALNLSRVILRLLGNGVYIYLFCVDAC